MNAQDYAVAKTWNASGFICFGRIYSKDALSPRGTRPVTHWVEFSEDAWKAAQQERRERAARLAKKRWWQKSTERS